MLNTINNTRIVGINTTFNAYCCTRAGLLINFFILLTDIHRKGNNIVPTKVGTTYIDHYRTL
jgi:hypothetical protein